ncbi:MAG: hypothetical protein IKB55_04455 [Clostridia bacterium]|nr:hypothetical protein [Clostridia bacterium]
MKIFIAGAKSIKNIDDNIKQKLLSIAKKNYDVLVGDCHGIDSAVQNYFNILKYPKVTIYASNGKARNNLGNWSIQNVPVEEGTVGFEFYRKKDVAMANEADYGFMVWDGKSKGTLNNIISLTNQNKVVLLYLIKHKKMLKIQTSEELSALISKCDKSTQALFKKYNSIKDDYFQITLFDDISSIEND